jgi:hypothetical protein
MVTADQPIEFLTAHMSPDRMDTAKVQNTHCQRTWFLVLTLTMLL